MTCLLLFCQNALVEMRKLELERHVMTMGPVWMVKHRMELASVRSVIAFRVSNCHCLFLSNMIVSPEKSSLEKSV